MFDDSSVFKYTIHAVNQVSEKIGKDEVEPEEFTKAQEDDDEEKEQQRISNSLQYF